MGLPQYKLSARLGESVESSTTQLTLGNWRISNESNNRIIELVCGAVSDLSPLDLRSAIFSDDSIKQAMRKCRPIARLARLTRLPRLPRLPMRSIRSSFRCTARIPTYACAFSRANRNRTSCNLASFRSFHHLFTLTCCRHHGEAYQQNTSVTCRWHSFGNHMRLCYIYHYSMQCLCSHC